MADEWWTTYFGITIDGVHCRFHEMKHPTLSKDPSISSFKFGGKQSLAYELA